MLCSASTRVATGGSVASDWIAFSAMLVHSRTGSVCVVATRVSVRATVWALPAASATLSVMLLSPSASATPGSWNLPLASAVLLSPWAASVMVAPASARPCSVTMAEPVWASLPASASMTPMPKLAPVGAWVSSLKATSTGVLALPAASLATTRTTWAPSASLPPASVSSTARLSVNEPLACNSPTRSVKLGVAPGSRATSRCVTPTSSCASPAMVGSDVMPSVAEMPVSWASAALSVGGRVSAAVEGSRVRVRLLVDVLPAASASVSTKALAPRLSEMPLKWKLPSAAATAVPSTVLLPDRRRVSAAPASVMPTRLTGLIVVCPSPTGGLSLAGSRPKLATTGAWVSRRKAMSTGVLALPAASLATTRTTWAPSASLPPASVSSAARLSVKLPLACSRPMRSVKLGVAPGSRATSRCVTPTSSCALPEMVGSDVMPSDAEAPVSLASAALSVGGVVSGMASRVTVRLPVDVLPAASASVSTKALAPRSSAMPLKRKLPSAAATAVPSTVLLPARRRVSAAPASVMPIRSTGLIVVWPSPTGALSLAGSRPKLVSTGGMRSGGRLPSCGSVAGFTLRPPMLTVVGNIGATTAVLPSSLPLTVSSWRRCTAVPSWRSLPSKNTPLTGSTLTIR